MAKINLTTKPIPEQVRILKDYLSRRSQHKTQGEVSLDQIVKRFKHKKLLNVKTKMSHFDKLLKIIKNDSPQ
jgi:hypothetical protein